MKTRWIMTTGLFSALFAMVMLAAPTANAKVMIMGSDGWEVSFDGSVNSFYVNAGKERPENSAGKEVMVDGTMYGGMTSTNNTTSRVTVGLLPAVLGINIKSPTMNGLTMGARFGLYPSTQNRDKKKNQFFAQNDFREAFFTVDGDFGQVLVGKTLSLYMGKNILTDMTLFGVGAVGADGPQGVGTTTLGRIGYGYVYPNFNAGLRYSTPEMNGFKATVGVYDPSIIGGAATTTKAGDTLLNIVTTDAALTRDNSNFDAATKTLDAALPGSGTTGATNPTAITAGMVAGTSLNATETNLPRIEGELSWAGSMDDVSSTVWVNGMWQSAKRSTASWQKCRELRTAFNTAADGDIFTKHYKDQVANDCKEVDAWGTGAGIQMSWQGLTLTGSGYYGEGLGSTLMLDTDSLDPLGNPRDNYGYIGQLVYAFGQGTSIGASYGGNYQQPSDVDKYFAKGYAGKALTAGDETIAAGAQIIKRQNLLDFMLWHDINANLRVVAEYGRQENGWMNGTTQNINIVSVGGFFFW